MPSEKQIEAWPLNGYAPGKYSCKCYQCGEDFIGAKRAIQCLECAVKRAKHALTAAEQAEPAPAAEPFCWIPTATAKWLEEYDGPACGTKTVAHNRPIKTDGGVPLYARPTFEPAPAAEPVVQAVFETAADGIIGRTSVNVKRVEREDDGSLTVVIDYWPRPSPEAEPVAWLVSGEGPGWKEHGRITFDRETAEAKMASPSHTVEALYKAPPATHHSQSEPVASRRWDTTYPGGQWLYFTGPNQEGEKLYTHPTPSEARLREAAQRVVDRWDTPQWKNAVATAIVVNDLRAALKEASE